MIRLSARDLLLGFIEHGNNIYDEVVEEMLDHQGICYTAVMEKDVGTSFPLVIRSTRKDEVTGDAVRHVSSDAKTLVAEEVVDLPRILKCLAGEEEGDHQDRLDLFVNEEEQKLVNVIEKMLSEIGLPLVTKDFWPGGAPACCVLTHDIDWLTYSPFHKAVIRNNRNPVGLFKLLLGGIAGRNYGWNIPTVLEMERKYGFKSTFFFRTEYDSGGELLPETVRLVRGGGDEAGLHGAHLSHVDSEALKGELRSLAASTGVEASGTRHHILKFSVPDTWVREEELGLKYDATFAYNGFFGFRGAVCFPYHPICSSRMRIVELPTSFMDWTGLNRGMSEREMASMLEKLADMVERYHGVLVVNLHNTYLNRSTFPGMVRVYENLLARVSERKYWVATARECVEWWEARASSPPLITYEDGLVKVRSAVPLKMSSAKEGIAFEYA